MENEKRLDLIDRKKLFNDLADYWGVPRDWDGRMLQACEDALSMIENAPTVDAVEVVHGRWVDSRGDTVAIDADGCPIHSCSCSVCEEWLTASDEYACIGKYCPNCGAKMDAEEF